MKTVCVLFGGKSSEYEVSLSSAHAVLSNIDKTKYNVIRIGITKEDGRFYRYDGDPEAIRDGSWCADRTKLCGVALSLSDGRLIFQPRSDGYAPEAVVPDVVFPVLHGRFGEDGTVQGMFAVAGIPVVSCDCTSSGVCMDKAITKAVISADTSVPQVECVVAHLGDDTEALRAKCESTFGYPMFVKPCRAGSSVGVTKVKDAGAFAAALACAFREDDMILIERAVRGREIEVAVLEEHGEYTVAIPAEIDLGGSEFYDYDTKYVSDCSSYYLPARLTETETAQVRRMALEVFRALGCKIFARVDFFIEDGHFIFNEINTIPGFTPISMYPKMMIHYGIPYAALIDRMIAAAL